MNNGDKITFLRDHENPLTSPNTHLIASLLSCGGALQDKDPFFDSVESTGSGPRRTVVWCAQEKEIEFAGPPPEKISTREFFRRWNDRAWIVAHPDHPISHVRHYQETLANLRAEIKKTSPTFVVKQPGGTYFIPAAASDAERARILALR